MKSILQSKSGTRCSSKSAVPVAPHWKPAQKGRPQKKKHLPGWLKSVSKPQAATSSPPFQATRSMDPNKRPPATDVGQAALPASSPPGLLQAPGAMCFCLIPGTQLRCCLLPLPAGDFQQAPGAKMVFLLDPCGQEGGPGTSLSPRGVLGIYPRITPMKHQSQMAASRQHEIEPGCLAHSSRGTFPILSRDPSFQQTVKKGKQPVFQKKDGINP